MHSLIRRNAKSFSLYILFAGIATVVDFGLLYTLTELAGIHYFVSAMCSYTAGMVTNYSLNKKRTFNNKSKRIKTQFSLFVSVALVGLVINQGIIYILVESAHLWYIYAKFIAMWIVVIWSYIGHKKITFGIIR